MITLQEKILLSGVPKKELAELIGMKPDHFSHLIKKDTRFNLQTPRNRKRIGLLNKFLNRKIKSQKNQLLKAIKNIGL